MKLKKSSKESKNWEVNKMKLAYYPGCSLEGTGIEYHLSTKKSAEILGVDLVEIDDWNCCGATSAQILISFYL